MNMCDGSLILLKRVANKLTKKFGGSEISKRNQVILMFFSRAIIDIESAKLLISAGYIGSAKTLLASFHRNMMMFASLIDAEDQRVNMFFDEDEHSYDKNVNNFAYEFSDKSARKLAQSKFGIDAFHKAEFEKCLHGSSHAIRKFYTDRKIENGKRIPVLMFGAFHHREFDRLVLQLIDGYVLDFLGIFFTKYQGDAYYKIEEQIYMRLVTDARKGLS